VETTPYTSEQLALPGVKEIIQQCEREGLLGCDSHSTATNDMSEFDRAVHSEVIVKVTLIGAASGKLYAVEWKLFNPNDELAVRYTVPITFPSNWNPAFRANYWLFWEPTDRETWQLGEWSVDIFVNGQLEARRSFTVVDSVS
jgi:hypothetical protein